MTTTFSKRQNGNAVPGVENLINSLFAGSLQRIFPENVLSDAPVLLGRVPVNIRETDKEYEIDVVAPGCRKENFTVNMNDKLLTVAYSPESVDSNEKVAWARNEYIQAAFSKSFTVDDSVDVNNINASYRDGILHIGLAKNERAKSAVKQIEIK